MVGRLREFLGPLVLLRPCWGCGRGDGPVVFRVDFNPHTIGDVSGIYAYSRCYCAAPACAEAARCFAAVCALRVPDVPAPPEPAWSPTIPTEYLRRVRWYGGLLGAM